MISNDYLRKFAGVRSTKYNRKAWLDAVAKDCGGGCSPDKDTPKKDDVEDPDKRDTGAVIGDEAADYAAKDIALTTAGMLQQWAETDDDDLDEGESYAARLMAMMIGVADANKDGELDENEQAVVNMALESAWDYLASKGVEDGDIDALLNDWDDDAAERVKELLAGVLPDGDEAINDIDEFAFTDYAENDDPDDPDATNVNVDKAKKSKKDDVDESDDDDKQVKQDKAKKSKKDDADEDDEEDDDDEDDDDSDESDEDSDKQKSDKDKDALAADKKVTQDKAKKKKSKKDDADEEDPDLEEGDPDATDPLMDATYKKKMVIRHGKKVRINKRVSGKVRLSAKQKMAIRKARMKSHSAAAMMRRAKSQRLARKMTKSKK